MFDGLLPTIDRRYVAKYQSARTRPGRQSSSKTCGRPSEGDADGDDDRIDPATRGMSVARTFSVHISLPATAQIPINWRAKGVPSSRGESQPPGPLAEA
jgi:hypothetical protein